MVFADRTPDKSPGYQKTIGSLWLTKAKSSGKPMFVGQLSYEILPGMKMTFDLVGFPSIAETKNGQTEVINLVLRKGDE